ncbi:MAG: serine hydrolase [Acidobacteriota bacterium]|nr:serine hydrolase [Acidobacteriota bacterium]
MKIIQLNIAFLLLLFVCGVVFSQTMKAEPAAKTVKRIESYLNKIESVGFSGVVLVELNSRKVVSKGYGFRNDERKLKNTPDTVFDIGSITKQFTGAAVMKLEMQGRLNTDDKISKYFSGVPADKAEITIHQLLRHSSGLPSVVGGDFDPISQSEYVEKAFSAPLKFESGSQFSYSNVGYSLLAMIVEKVSGQSYEQFLYENLWKPANMESTGYTRPNFDMDLIAVGYRDGVVWGKPNEQAWDKDAPFWHLKGNGGILSTTEDLYKWHQELNSDGILTREAKEKYFRPKLRENETLDSYYAYGWDVHKTRRNRTLIQHNGTNRVFYADFHRYPDEKTTIITLSNKAHPIFFEINGEISKIIFDSSYQPVIPIADNKTNRVFTENIIRITLEEGFEAGVKSYKKRPRGVNLLERVVNAKGYELLSDKKLPKAVEVFKLNVFAFPKSANAFDSLGEAYLEAGNKDLAIENYKKSLMLNPENKNAEEVLQRLVNK